MPHTTQWEPNGVYRKYSGTVDEIEILESNFSLHADKRFNAIVYVINDFSGVDAIQISAQATIGFAASDQVISDRKVKLKIAIINDNPVYMPIAQAYIQHMRDCSFECELFPTLQLARAWVEQ